MKSKKLLCLFLALSMCVSLSVFSVNAVVAEERLSEVKVADDLKARLYDANENELIPVYIWIDDINHNEVKSKTVKNTGLSEENLASREKQIFVSRADAIHMDEPVFKSIDELSDFMKDTQSVREKLSEDVDTYITEKREVSREAYSKSNGEFATENLRGKEIIFKSQYAPMIICNMTKSEIKALSNNKKVSALSLYVDYEVEDCGNLNISLPAISADITRNQGITGNYVKIGQIETGRPKTGVSALSGKSITRRGTTTTDHASLVAAIMIGSNGVAPGASLYSTSAYYNVTTNSDNSAYSTAVEYENIEWLVSQGVTIINRSFGGSTGGSYNSFSQWIDHIVNQHNVTFVQAAGNSGPSGYVYLQSYNAIVVGGINDMGTLSKSDDTYYSSTSYLSSGNNKPDVVAPAVGFSIPEAYGGEAVSGTSFAAPHVTGMVAQMMCTVTSLKLRPDAIKAAVMASCDRKTVPGASLTTLTNEEGAGVVNALHAVNSLSRVALQQTNYTTTANSVTFNFYPQTTGTKTVVISWLRDVTGSGTNHSTISTSTLTDFDLYIYDSSGNEIARSLSSVNNVEFIRFNATTTAKYTVVIKRFTNNTTSERITLANHR